MDAKFSPYKTSEHDRQPEYRRDRAVMTDAKPDGSFEQTKININSVMDQVSTFVANYFSHRPTPTNLDNALAEVRALHNYMRTSLNPDLRYIAQVFTDGDFTIVGIDRFSRSQVEMLRDQTEERLATLDYMIKEYVTRGLSPTERAHFHNLCHRYVFSCGMVRPLRTTNIGSVDRMEF